MWFYKIIDKISNSDIVDGARDFRLMKREMVDAIVSMSKYNRFSKGILGWIGYWPAYENVERVTGETNRNIFKLTKYAIDEIINFSQAPLSFASWIGIIMTGIAFIFPKAINRKKLVAFALPIMSAAPMRMVSGGQFRKNRRNQK